MQIAVKELIHDDDSLHRTTLSKMRDQFQDLLADFHCVDKQIYLLKCERVAPAGQSVNDWKWGDDWVNESGWVSEWMSESAGE